MSDPNNVVQFDVAAAKAIVRKAEKGQLAERARKELISEEWESSLLFDEKGGFDKRCGANVTTVLMHHETWKNAIRFDVFAGRLTLAEDCPAGAKGEELADHHDKRVSDWLEASKYGLRPSKGVVIDSINAVARMREIHPVRDYLAALVWDGKPRVNLFAAKYLNARPGKGDGQKVRYLAQVSAILLIGPVARVMRPGCMLKTVPILEGAQDLGKSRAIRALCPREEWFSDSEIPYGSKDSFQGLRGKWLIELAEVDKDLRGRASAAQIKAFISSPSDYYRDPFGRRFADNPRQGAFIGSTNHREYLNDETGGARFLPFKCGRPDVNMITRDRDQLWAEAFHRFTSGEKWWIEDAAITGVARKEQADRYAGDSWESKVQSLLEGQGNPPEEGITTQWILGELGFHISLQGVPEQMRVARILTSLGWTQERRQKDGKRLRIWVPCPT